MNAVADIVASPLSKLREPFPPNQISKLPKPTKAQTEAVRNDFKKGVRCKECGAWHHPDVAHLDYVGHAALTDRLLDADPEWSWEPAALDEQGLPAFDRSGGLWIKLTVCGVTRLGYGHAASKNGQDPGAREKEVIGDALRNAAMRFGAALDLWHKGDLHVETANEDADAEPRSSPPHANDPITDDQRDVIQTLAPAAGRTTQEICNLYEISNLKGLTAGKAAKLIERLQADAKARAAKPQASDILDDEIPYQEPNQ